MSNSKMSLDVILAEIRSNGQKLKGALYAFYYIYDIVSKVNRRYSVTEMYPIYHQLKRIHKYSSEIIQLKEKIQKKSLKLIQMNLYQGEVRDVAFAIAIFNAFICRNIIRIKFQLPDEAGKFVDISCLFLHDSEIPYDLGGLEKIIKEIENDSLFYETVAQFCRDNKLEFVTTTFRDQNTANMLPIPPPPTDTAIKEKTSSLKISLTEKSPKKRSTSKTCLSKTSPIKNSSSTRSTKRTIMKLLKKAATGTKKHQNGQEKFLPIITYLSETVILIRNVPRVSPSSETKKTKVASMQAKRSTKARQPENTEEYVVLKKKNKSRSLRANNAECHVPSNVDMDMDVDTEHGSPSPMEDVVMENTPHFFRPWE